MGLFDITPGDNPRGYATLSFGIEGQAPGFTVDTDGTATFASVVSGSASVISVLDYLAPADRGTSDPDLLGAAVTAALAAAPAAAVVELAGGKSYRAGPWTVAQPQTIRGPGATILAPTTSGLGAFTVTASGVSIEDLNFTGRQSAATVTGEVAIAVAGPSLAGRLTNVRIQRCSFTTWGLQAINLKWVFDFAVVDNRITDIAQGGIVVLSGQRGVIRGNRISDILQSTGATHSYGIILSRDSLVTEVLAPVSKDIVVEGNTIDGVLQWEGIDTHGGQNITVVGNVIRNVKYPIAMVACPDPAGDELYAPQNVTVTGNTIESGVTDGSLGYGISLVGAFALGAIQQYATGVISGNVINNVGDDANINSGGIVTYWSEAPTIAGNVIRRACRSGIVIINDVVGASVTGNTIVDTWTDAGPVAISIKVGSGNVSATFSGNTFPRGTLTGKTHMNERGINYADVAGTVPSILGSNDYRGVTTPLSDAGGWLRPGIVTGTTIAASRYIMPEGTRTTTAMLADVEYASPLWVAGPGTVVRMGVETTVAGTAGTVLRLGIRQDLQGSPGPVVGETTVAGDAAPGVIEATVAIVIPTPGLYWLTVTAQVTGGTLPTVRGSSGDRAPAWSTTLAAALSASGSAGLLTAATVSGALPVTYTVSSRAASTPLMVLRG